MWKRNNVLAGSEFIQPVEFMKKKFFRVGFAALALIAAAGFFSPARAAQSQTVDIHVSISATKDLTVDSTSYNFGALGVNTASVTATGITVTNASNGLISTFTIQGANASSVGGAAWTLVSSTGNVNEYKLAAQFSNTRPSNVDGAWTSDDLTTSAAGCTKDVFGNGTLGESGASVSPLAGLNQRTLWFRLVTPLSVTDTTQHDISVTLAVQ
jgi:hypothetical protein